jgi:hypothetical protein
MKTQRERAEERRAEKLVAMQERIDDGTLVVRTMTARERAENPPQPRPERGGGRGRRRS